jgi:hypothetical protein
MLKSPSLAFFVLVLFSVLCIYVDFSPPKGRDEGRGGNGTAGGRGSADSGSIAGRADSKEAAVAGSADTNFSARRALTYLRPIARAPHSLGTPENLVVRDLIIDSCRKLGLEVDTQHVIAVITEQGGMDAGEVYNITARLKGYDSSRSGGSGKTVLIVAHYDSEPNASGASDDGSGCAAILETARLLKASHPLKNDVVFLFTSGEENGLLGATAFVQESPLLKEVGVVINFDARGSRGRSYMFRSNGGSAGSGSRSSGSESAGNHWIIDQFARSGAHTNASSLYYEIFKLLPNNTDFSPFAAAGLPGLDFAFIDGIEQYHCLSDDISHIDTNTLQEHGENMTAVAKHFGDLDLGVAGKLTNRNDSYFNPFGDYLFVYPASWNTPLLIIANVLLLAQLIIGFVKKHIQWKGFLIGIVAFPIALGALYLLDNSILSLIRKASPLYLGYYPNLYNALPIHITLIGLNLLVFAAAYRLILRRWTTYTLFAAILLEELIVVNLASTYIPTAIYFLCGPLLVVLIAGFFPKILQKTWVCFLFLLIPVMLLSPIIYTVIQGFNIQEPAAFAGPVLGLLLGLLLPLMALSLRENKWFIPGSALMIAIVACLIAPLAGKYSVRQPFKTDVHYEVNFDQGKAYWASRAKPDTWNSTLLKNASLAASPYFYFGAGSTKEFQSPATMTPLPSPSVLTLSDSVNMGKRLLTLRCQPGEGAVSTHLGFDTANCPQSIVLNGKTGSTGKAGKFYFLDYTASSDSGFTIQLTLDTAKAFGFELAGRRLGLPTIDGFIGYPGNVIPFPGQYSNTSLAVKHFSF